MDLGGPRLRAAMRAASVTPAALAKLLGVDRALVLDVLAGRWTLSGGLLAWCETPHHG